MINKEVSIEQLFPGENIAQFESIFFLENKLKLIDDYNNSLYPNEKMKTFIDNEAGEIINLVMAYCNDNDINAGDLAKMRPVYEVVGVEPIIGRLNGVETIFNEEIVDTCKTSWTFKPFTASGKISRNIIRINIIFDPKITNLNSVDITYPQITLHYGQNLKKNGGQVKVALEGVAYIFKLSLSNDSYVIKM